MKDLKTINRMVDRKMEHWNITPKCSNTRNKMVELEKNNKLSLWEMRRLSDIPCTNCTLCTGQTNLDMWAQ